MLELTANLALALVPARSASDDISRNRSLLFEVYESNYYPDVDGLFDPADAIALWAKHDCTWLGNFYSARIFTHGELSEFISGQFNSITLTIENADRFLSQFCATQIVDGLRLVIRYVNWDHSVALEDSRQWVLRLQAPDNSELDREQGQLTAQEELATLDCEIPRGTITAEDPDGRSPNDILNEGFPFNAHQSLVKYNDPVQSNRFGFLPRKKDRIKFNQWSSVSETDGAVVPLIASGRAQLQGLPVFWFDSGFFIIGIWLFVGHKVTSITNFQLPDSNYIFYGWWADEAHKQTHVHLGDPGGTGTNATPDTIENTYPENTWYGSRKAYVGFAIGGPESESQPFANPQMDQVATLIGVVLVEMDLPDEDGIFNQVGFSDSPVYAARFVLTSPDFFGLEPELVRDDNLPAVHAERQRPIIDKSNGEFLALRDHDLSALINGNLTRLSSTGLIDSRYFRHLLDSGEPDPLTTNRDDAFAVSFGGENPGGGDHQLTDSVLLAGQTVATSAWKYYWIDVPTGATELQVVATGSGDGTTYVRAGSKPTLTSYDDFAYTASPQTVIVDNPVSGRWWVGMAGFQPDGTPAAGLSFSIIAIVTDGMDGNVLPAQPVVRKAWTLNLPLTDTSNAIDFLNNVVLPAGRLYRVTDTAGRQDIRAKRASDSTYLISDASMGATFVLVANVEPWRASLRGYLLINPGLVTSEYRAVTSAEYHPATGNAITLAVSGTGLTRSGATLAGGSTSVPSSGTVTVSGASGDLVVTVWDIPIAYTVLANDINESVAGMLAALINADPDLNQYVRAVWNEDNVVHIYSTVGKLIFASALVNDHESQVDSPVTEPTASATGSGTLAPGNYYLGYSLVDGSGSETLMSPFKKVTIAAGQKVSVASLGALPTGAAEVNWYFSPAVNDDHVRFLETNAGGSFTIDDVADYDQDFPSTLNQTGGETIRVAEVFNAFNMREGSFKWIPSASKINQTSGEYVDAANGFKRTKVTVNDRAHQRAIKQVNKKEINLSGVDNFSQASRLCHATLAEERDGGAGAKWMSDEAAIVLEIGDVVAVNDYRFDEGTGLIENYLVNQPIFVTAKTLSGEFDVSLTGKVYSSSLLEGQIGRKPVVVATTLKYLSEPPPVASNLTLTQTENYLTGIAVDFDFASFAGAQLAHVFLKGPSFVLPAVEPDDSEYKMVDTVYPDSNNHGHCEIRATSAGTYWIKVITQSVFGRSLSSGQAEDSILIRPEPPTSLVLTKISNDRVITWEPGVVDAFLPEKYILRVRDSSTAALKRTATIEQIQDYVPAKWTYNTGAGNQSLISRDPDGSIYTTVQPTDVLLYVSQAFAGDMDILWEVDSRPFFFLAISPVTPGPITGVYVEDSTSSGSPQFIDAEGATGLKRRLLAGSRLKIQLKNGHAEYYVNDALWMRTFQNPIDYPVKLSMSFSESLPGAQGALKVRVKPYYPRQFVYTDDMAKTDFGGTNPATVRFDITQIADTGIESLPSTVTG